MKLTEVNRMIAPEIQTIFIPSERKLSKVSSSHVKEIARQGEDVSDYCPQFVQEMLLKKIESQK